MWNADEIQTYKKMDLVKFAVSMGFEIDRKKSWNGTTILRNGEDKIAVTRKENGHYVYFSFREPADNGTIFDFLKFRGGGTFVEIVRELRDRVGSPKFFQAPPVKSTAKITEVGQPCRHCSTPVKRKEHHKPPKRTPSGYYYEWWLKCPNKKCNAIYLQEEAKRFFDAPAPALPRPDASGSDEYDRQSAEAMLDPRCVPVCLHDRYVPTGRPERPADVMPWDD